MEIKVESRAYDFDEVTTNDLECLHPQFKRVFQYIRDNDISSFNIGKYEIDGENLFLLVSDSVLKNKDEAYLEAHNKYIDIQMLLKGGSEKFGYAKRSNCKSIKKDCLEERDIIFFHDNHEKFFILKENQFTIFFPQDAHAPCIGSGTVKKCVFKIKV